MKVACVRSEMKTLPVPSLEERAIPVEQSQIFVNSFPGRSVSSAGRPPLELSLMGAGNVATGASRTERLLLSVAKSAQVRPTKSISPESPSGHKVSRT